MAEYTLEEVASRRAVREFLDLPKRLYRDEPHWICPLDQRHRESRFRRPETNELLRDGEADPLDRPSTERGTGRGPASRRSTTGSWWPLRNIMPTGGCGFFESIDDQQVADMLFDAARDWLARSGDWRRWTVPSTSATATSGGGCSSKGFEFTPLYTNPYNFEYYVRLFENYGFPELFQPAYLPARTGRRAFPRQRLRTGPAAEGGAALPFRAHGQEKRIDQIRRRFPDRL